MSVTKFALAAALAVAALGTAPALAADADAGGKVFKTQCAVCHSPVAGKNMVGPSLFGIVGRQSGSAPAFKYSAANKDSGVTWDETNLDKYLPNPRAFIPGTTMTYAGLKNDAQRADLIAYLASLK